MKENHYKDSSEESENGGKDKKEQQLKESINKQVDSCTNIVEENIKEGESDSGEKEEVDIEKQNNEAGEADGVKECETIGDVSKSTEGVSQYVEILYDKAGSPLGDEMDDETLNKKEDHVQRSANKDYNLSFSVSTAVMYDKYIKSIKVKVPDSNEEILLNPTTVRRNDRFAQSVDEWTSEQKLMYGDILEDMEPEEIQPMGNYAF
ncbi:hypothetical protein Tco_0746678 [Tanacetum coccineum]